MASRSIYTCKSTSADEAGNARYEMAKLDQDFDFQGAYIIVVGKGGAKICDCPARVAECRHMRALDIFIKEDAVDKGKFLSYDGKFAEFVEMEN